MVFYGNLGTWFSLYVFVVAERIERAAAVIKLSAKSKPTECYQYVKKSEILRENDSSLSQSNTK